MLEQERGSYLKKWTGRFPVALVYPNRYDVGMSSLGFQLVYSILNTAEDVVCERFFFPNEGELPLSLESGRSLKDFSLIFVSLSFEHDYLHLAQLLFLHGIEPFSSKRESLVSSSSPLIVCGGVATFMNPEPIAPFIDLFFIGEAEPLLPELLAKLTQELGHKKRTDLLFDLVRDHDGLYAPEFYTPSYGEDGQYKGYVSKDGVPDRIKKQLLKETDTAGHSQILTPEAEFADLYLTELGRGCSQGCRFCAAGFIYRPPRLWDGDAVVKGLTNRFSEVERVGLLGMEMAGNDELSAIADYITRSGCSLSFSSLRADRISQPLLELLANSSLKSVAIAPDGASERLRRVINKNLKEQDLIRAAEKLVSAGIYKLKIYIMIGLPTEGYEDIDELLELIRKIKESISKIGRKRGRLSEISLSINCFTPKPWTPFQYHAFGVSERLQNGEKRDQREILSQLKKKMRYLRVQIQKEANVHLQGDSPDKVLFQAVLARGDRRLASVLWSMAKDRLPWKQAMKKNRLLAEQFVLCGFDVDTPFPWYIIDHGIETSYLWQEYKRAFDEKTTLPCDTQKCLKCGVCHEK